MKRFVFRLTVLLMSLGATLHCNVLHGQGNNSGPTFPPSPFSYSLHTFFGPPGTDSIVVNDFKVVDIVSAAGVVAVGSFLPTDGKRRGFIYDLTDPNNPVFWDAIGEFGVVENQYIRSFNGISSTGIIVGYSRDNDTDDPATSNGIWVDLSDPNHTIHFLEDQFTELENIGRHSAVDINNNGDILVSLRNNQDAQFASPLCFIANPTLGEMDPVVTGELGQYDIPIAFNDSRVIVGELWGGQ